MRMENKGVEIKKDKCMILGEAITYNAVKLYEKSKNRNDNKKMVQAAKVLKLVEDFISRNPQY